MERSIYWTQEANKVTGTQQEIFNDKAKKLTKICMLLKTAGYKDSVMKECKSLFTDEKFEELLDNHSHLLGFENGVYDLRMHEFRDGLPDDYISYSTGRNYMKYEADAVESKEIHAYLSQVFTNDNVRKYMMDLMACMVDGAVRQEKFYIFTGSGANSKSVLLNLIQRAIGDYYCILPIALLTQKRVASNSAQSELERTKGRRLAVMQEPGENEKINIGLMKELSGQDRILTRGLFKEPIEFKPQFKMVMTCNELPEVPSDDGGTWRRIRVIEYTSKFTENPNPKNPKEFPLDPDLPDKIERWADTFISMILDHHQHMNVKDIHEPTEVRIATEGYKKNNDIIGQYIDEKMVKDENSTDRVALQKTFLDFRAWANQVVQKGKKLPDRNQLRAYMEKTFGAYPSDGKGWRGIRLLQKAGNDADSDVD
jgi:P4 family phage/plasmid primase-like protien